MDYVFIRKNISIHAPRMGSDLPSLKNTLPTRISIHAPRMGSDEIFTCVLTPIKYFNPRSPHGERLILRGMLAFFDVISIHAPRMGSDYQKQYPASHQ